MKTKLNRPTNVHIAIIVGQTPSKNTLTQSVTIIVHVIPTTRIGNALEMLVKSKQTSVLRVQSGNVGFPGIHDRVHFSYF